MTAPPEDRTHGRRVLFLEPWLGGSHRILSDAWTSRSRHRVEVEGLAPRHWRWRQEASGWELARLLAGESPPDVLAVSDFVDLPRLLGFLPADWAGVPTIAYFHENQLTYRPGDADTAVPEDAHAAFANVLTALRADQVVFNSSFHRDDLAAAGDRYLRTLPRPSPRAEFAAAMEAGHPVRVPVEPTLADGLAVPEVGPRAFGLAKDRIDEIHAVGEESLSLAILRLAELHRGVVEGGGAASLAAFLEGRLDHLRDRTVVLLLCGGNIDPMVLSRVIEHGLAVDGRLLRFTAVIRDRPGGLHQLVTAIAAAGASVRDIRHERAFGGPDVSTVLVDCTLEVRDREHGTQVRDSIESAGIALRLQETADPV